MRTEYIESTDRLEHFLEHINDSELIAVDTEFFRETSYYPKLALIQIATDDIVALIDPLAFDARPQLKKLFLDPALIKVFHSCSQDLEVLYHYLGYIPTTIYDTQIAYALLSDQAQIGYASLVEKTLNIRLDKSQTRTNWLKRPLSKNQLRYASDDVIYLYQLYAILEKQLQEAGRKGWFEEDNTRLANDKNTFEVDEEKLWQRVKGSSRLSARQLAVVQGIAIWREQQAQKKDQTRKRILSDEKVIQLAITPPDSISMMDQIIEHRTNHSGNLDNSEQQLFDAIQAAQRTPAETWPNNRFRILDKQQKLLLKDLQQIINDHAKTLDISSSVLCSRKDLELLIKFNNDNPDLTAQQLTSNQCVSNMNCMQGWRYRCFGQALVSLLIDTE